MYIDKIRDFTLQFNEQNTKDNIYYILSYSFPVLPHTTAIKEICFYLAIIITLFLIVFKRGSFIFKTPLTYPLMFFLLWSFLSIFWSLNVENSINDVRAHLLNHIILYFLLINFFNSNKRLASLAWIVAISATAFSIIGMFYYYTTSDTPINMIRLGYLLNGVNVSTELPVNFIGTITVFAVIICLHFYFQEFRLYHRVSIIACMIPSFIATLSTQSKGTFLSLIIASTILMLLKTKKIALFLFLAMVLLIVVLTPLKDRLNTNSIKDRLKINYITCEVIKDYPILGIGFGMQTFINNIDKESYVNRTPKKYRPAEIYTPHNLLLDITVRLGLIGLLLFLYIIFVFGKMCFKIIRYAKNDYIRDWGICTVSAFVAYFVIGMGEPVFLFRPSTIVFYVILAVITILWHLNQEEQGSYDQPDTEY